MREADRKKAHLRVLESEPNGWRYTFRVELTMKDSSEFFYMASYHGQPAPRSWAVSSRRLRPDRVWRREWELVRGDGRRDHRGQQRRDWAVLRGHTSMVCLKRRSRRTIFRPPPHWSDDVEDQVQAGHFADLIECTGTAPTQLVHNSTVSAGSGLYVCTTRTTAAGSRDGSGAAGGRQGAGKRRTASSSRGTWRWSRRRTCRARAKRSR